MVTLFINTSFSSVFILIVLALLVHTHFFIAPAIVVTGEDGLISFLLKQYIQPLPSVFLWLVYMGILLLQAIRLNMVLNENKMFHNGNFTTAMAYVVVSGLFPEWCSITPAFIANTFLIWILIQLFKLYNSPAPKVLLFNTGLIAGFSVICYHPTAILIVVILFALIIVRPFRIAEWIVLLMGVITPLYILFSILFLTDKWNLVTQFLPKLHLGLPKFQYKDFWVVFTISTIFISLLAGLVYYSNASNRVIIQIRKNWSVLVVMLLLMLPIPFIFTNTAMYAVEMLIIPLSAFIANAYLYPKKLLFPNLLFFLAVAAIIHNNWSMS